MFLGLNSGKTNRIHPLSAHGKLRGHGGTALLQRVIKVLGLSVLLSHMGVASTPAAEAMPIISIEYGIVATYHRVEWDHPQLPIDIVRGAPPATIDDANEDTASAGSSDSSQVLTDVSDDTDEQDAPGTLPAILYEIDLADQGMLSIISSQLSVEPGHCAAIERGQDYLNLRRVHVEFCNPVNQPLAQQLTRYHGDIATLCQTTKNQPTNADKPDETARHIAQVSMLCDG